MQSITPSLVHNFLSYAEDYKGEEKYSISIKDLRNNKLYPNEVHNMKGSKVWHRNNKGFFYRKIADKKNANKVYYHELGKKKAEDILVYEENKESFDIDIYITSDNKYLIIHSSNNSEDEIRILNLEDKLEFKTKFLLKKYKDQKYNIDHRDGWFFLKINDKGKNFRLVRLKENDFTNKENWVEIIPHSDDNLLLSYSMSKKYLVANIRVKGATKIQVYDHDWKKDEVIFEENAYQAYDYFTTYDSTLVRIDYSSFIIPQSVLEYDCDKKKWIL